MDILCQDKQFFKNPAKVALNKLTLEIRTYSRNKKIPKDKEIADIKDSLHKYYDIKIEKIPALDQAWIQKKHSYHTYQPYYSEVSPEENEYFLLKNKLFLENLKFLLQCTYHQFWCYVIYEPKVVVILDSFIKNPIAWYELEQLKEDHLKLYESLHECVAKIILRLLTFQESDIEFMDNETALKYLNELHLFTCPKIVNLCILYSQSNIKLIDRIMQIFFNAKREKHYKQELKSLLDHSLLAFEMVGGQICGFEDNSVIVPFNIRLKPKSFDPYWIEEVVSYLLDMAVSLHTFLSYCKPAIEMAFTMHLPFRLAYLHNRVYEELYKLMKSKAVLPYDWSELKNRIFLQIALGRSEFVNTFHVFVANLIDNIIQSVGKENQMEYVEQYFQLVLSAFEDEFFAFDYHNAKEIDVQLQMIADFCPEIDQMRINYILECLTNIIKISGKSTKRIEVTPTTFEAVPGTSGVQNHKQKKKEFTEQEIEKFVHEVLDALPHLGDGFILKCLEVYDFNTHEVISAILDQNLSPLLNDVPQDLIRIPPEPKPAKPILEYKGKKPEYKDTLQLLNDKSDIQTMKDFVLKSSNVYYDVYDDEYDDRYDDEPARHFHEKSEEPDLYKYMENRFEGYEVVSDPSSSDEEDNVPNSSVKQNNLYQDPALLRARKEEQRKQVNKSRDVVGKPKGQGQEKNVVNNRNKKNVNKSSRANHNRKSGAQWKRNKGMFPS